jgi:multicomponent Na+:H+ antiporter subunit B
MDISVAVLAMNVGLMAMMVVVAFAIVRLRSLFAIVMLQGVYSLVSAVWFVSLDAVDVAFTEAAVGAGISTVLMLGAMLLTDRDANPIPVRKNLGPLLVVIVTGLAMFYAIGDMPAYGDAHSAANAGVGMAYIEATREQVQVPNVVTAVLASYRGFDTFGETVVIFMAGLGIMLLLGLNGNAGKWRAKPNGQCVGMDGPAGVQPPEPKPARKKATTPRKKAGAKKSVTKAVRKTKAGAKK